MSHLPRCVKYFCAAGLLLCGFSACKKKKSEDPDAGQGVGRCRLSGYSTYQNSILAGQGSQILYDAEGRLLSMSDPSARTDFIYRGDTIFSTASGAGCNHTDTIVLENGRIKVAAYGDGRVHQHVCYFYNAAGVLERSCCDFNGALQEDYFIWSGGDLITDSIVLAGQPAGIVRYEFDLAHSNQIGNPGTVMFFLTTGIPEYHTRHLLKSVEGQGWSYQYHYDFDADGRIVRAYSHTPAEPKDAFYFEYAYECQ